jgi:hypothetical protein
MDRLRTIATVYGQSELAMLRGLLARQGIASWTVGERHVAINWGIALGLGGVRLQVHDEDWAEAAELVRALEPYRYGAGMLLRDRLADVALILSLFLMGGVPPPVRMPAIFHVGRGA